MLRSTTILVIVLAGVLLAGCRSQKPGFARSFPDRYSLDLPHEWKKKGKLINAITEIMPKVFPQLEGKDFCLDCETPYNVRFEISQINMAGHADYMTIYRFKAAFTLYDQERGNQRRLVVIDPEKEESVFYNGATPPEQVGNRRMPSRGGAVQYRNFVKLAEKKMYKIRQMLNKQE